MTNPDIIKKLKENGIKQEEIYADCADPKCIFELKQSGFNVFPASKGADSVNFGIGILQQQPIVFVDSPDLWKERNNYEWKKDNNGKSINKPIDAYNHGFDAARYYAIEKLSKSEFRMSQ